MSVIASLDLGTNSTRVLVARSVGGRLETLDRRNTITRLGQGVGATGRLGDEAVERTLACLRSYREVLDAHGVEQLRAAATSAARDAANREAFFDAVEDVVGVRPELLSGAERAACLRGATGELDPSLPSSSSTSAAARPEFIVGTDDVEA